MDADDLMHPERIAKQCAFLEENSNIDVIDTTTYTVDDDLAPLGIRGEEPLDCSPESVLKNGLLIPPDHDGEDRLVSEETLMMAFTSAPKTASYGAELAPTRNLPGCANRYFSIAKASPAT